jgi:hypothetical protein
MRQTFSGDAVALNAASHMCFIYSFSFDVFVCLIMFYCLSDLSSLCFVIACFLLVFSNPLDFQPFRLRPEAANNY